MIAVEIERTESLLKNGEDGGNPDVQGVVPDWRGCLPVCGMANAGFDRQFLELEWRT